MPTKNDPQDDPAHLATLLALYCELIDTRALDRLSEVFAADCRVVYGSQAITGLPALVDHLTANLGAFAETAHRIGDVTRIGPRRWRATVVAWHRFEVDRPPLTLHGRYDCRLVDADLGPRLTELVGSEVSRESGRARPE